jgi:glycine/D-amino acid oxidase-like deaminating enzyme/nitrite reductase/ring-hydroxylating ferredoxin subunit
MTMREDETSIGRAESVWVATTSATNYPPLSALSGVEVAVIGGGIAGLTTAILLQRAGVRVVILEKDEIVKGVTGYTTAKVTALHNLIYDHLIKHFGEEQGRMYAEANEAGLEQIATFVAEQQIDCDFKRTAAYTFAESEQELEHVEAEVKAAMRVGLPASFVGQIALPIPTKGAITLSNQAQFHPRKYLLALAENFVRNGGLIFEHTRVTELKEASPCIITTDKGTVSAQRVVVTTHFPIYDPALYFSRLSPHRSLVIGMRLKETVPEGMYIGAGEESHSFRNQPADDGLLLLIGGEGFKTGQGGDILERYHRLEHYARHHFNVISIDYHWSTQDNRTLDRVPYIGPIGPNSTTVFVATGFGGWGMTNGTASGLILSDLVLGRDNAWSPVFNPNRIKPLTSAGQAISEGVNVAAEVVTAHLPILGSDDIASLANGEGKVIQINKEKVAVSKDKQGNLHAVSAVCTHMGCVVNWNNGEKSWDCPCHGSRFSPDGRVLHGPAVADLEKKQAGTA